MRLPCIDSLGESLAKHSVTTHMTHEAPGIHDEPTSPASRGGRVLCTDRSCATRSVRNTLGCRCCSQKKNVSTLASDCPPSGRRRDGV